MHHVIALGSTRSVETPAAEMNTYVSPTTELRTDLSVWRTRMGANKTGPIHTVDTDHVVVVLEGSLRAEVSGDEAEVAVGECILLPANTRRRLSAGPEGLTMITAALPGSTASMGDAKPVVVPWAN